MSNVTEFAIWDGEEFFAQVNGPRDAAWIEAQGYASQCEKPVIEEVTRREVDPANPFPKSVTPQPVLPFEVEQLRETAKSFRATGDHGTAHLMERSADLLEMACVVNLDLAKKVADIPERSSSDDEPPESLDWAVRPVPFIEELRIEGAIVPNRRGKLYTEAALRIEELSINLLRVTAWCESLCEKVDWTPENAGSIWHAISMARHALDANPPPTRYSPNADEQRILHNALKRSVEVVNPQSSGSTQEKPDCDCGPSPQVIVCEFQPGRTCRWERIYKSTETHKQDCD